MSFMTPSRLKMFQAAYPLAPAVFPHDLAAHPLLSLSALADAAGRMPPHHVERRIANAPNGGDFAMAGGDDRTAQDIIPDIMVSGNWVMLRFVEQLPEYQQLVRELIAELDPMVRPVTGQCQLPKAFIFISAPDTLTPFHFDAEYNILFQIAGAKQFATYPARPPFLTLQQREAYHGEGANMLPWRDGDEAAATVHPLNPGDAIYVPYTAPHWVRVGSQASISLSLTWQSDWTCDVGDALHINALLRRFGLPGGEPPVWPKRPVIRALAARAARRMRLL